MTGRDRLMIVAIVAIAVLLGGYLTVVSPERGKASKVSAEVASARQALESAQTVANEAVGARGRYATAYASLVSLGPAVPASSETPALVFAVDAAANSKKVEFTSITSGGSGASGSSAGASSSIAAPASAAASTAFTQMPFGFVVNGSYEGLYRMLAQLEGFTTQTTSGGLQVSGRLLTIDGIVFAGASASGASTTGSGGQQQLSVTVTATAYVLPPGAATASGATPTSPAGASPASTGAAASSPTSAAVIKATP